MDTFAVCKTDFIHNKRFPTMRFDTMQKSYYKAPSARWCEITAERGFSASEPYPGGDAEPLDYEY